jgi:hypothetical protein
MKPVYELQFALVSGGWKKSAHQYRTKKANIENAKQRTDELMSYRVVKKINGRIVEIVYPKARNRK